MFNNKSALFQVIWADIFEHYRLLMQFVLNSTDLPAERTANKPQFVQVMHG